MTAIAERDLATATIGDTDVTVADLVDIFVRTQDGRQDREMHDEHGVDLGDRVRDARAALLPIHRRL